MCQAGVGEFRRSDVQIGQFSQFSQVCEPGVCYRVICEREVFEPSKPGQVLETRSCDSVIGEIKMT